MIFWVQICSFVEYYIAFDIIMLMVQVDDFMIPVILQYAYNLMLNHHFMILIYNLMKLLICLWLYHHRWMVQDMTFMLVFSLNFQISQGAL